MKQTDRHRKGKGQIEGRSVRAGQFVFGVLGFAVWGQVATAQTAPASGAICSSQLGRTIEAVVDRPEFRRVHWGLRVETQTGELLYERESQRYFVPASNAKLLTSAAVLTQLGSSFRIRTSVYQIADAGETVLRVVGRGDPSLTDEQLRQLARQIRDRNLTRVDRLIGETSFFRGDPVNPTWDWEDLQAGYGASANSLIVNENAINVTLVPQAIGQPLRVMWDDPAEGRLWEVVNRSQTVATDASEFVSLRRDFSRPILYVEGQLRVGSEPDLSSIAIPNPDEAFMSRFQQILIAEGVTVARIELTREAIDLPSASEVAAVDSAPLATLLVETNQNSNNLYAESLLRQLGNASDRQTSSLEAGISMLQTILARLGVDPSGYALADGSGLSRQNWVSPATLVQVLQAMARSPQAQAYRNSLAIAGQSGTLRHRFVDTPVQGRLHGKTGALGGAAALSGYLEPIHYSPLVFSIIVNHFDRPVREMRQAIDEIVLLLVSVRSCPSTHGDL